MVNQRVILQTSSFKIFKIKCSRISMWRLKKNIFSLYQDLDCNLFLTPIYRYARSSSSNKQPLIDLLETAVFKFQENYKPLLQRKTHLFSSTFSKNLTFIICFISSPCTLIVSRKSFVIKNFTTKSMEESRPWFSSTLC